MDLTFANPAGFWALLGLPAVLAIHFLQTKARQARVSTLFLLNELAKESIGGRRLERLRNSLPLWLQLLAVLIAAWLLAQPRWLRAESVQSIVVVLDSSVSMRAFHQRLDELLPPRLAQLRRAAARTEWMLLETDPRAGTLYSGSDLGALAEAMRRWTPRLGAHDFTPAFRSAQQLVRRNGALVFATDHVIEVPEGVDLFAVGEPVENVGFCGLRVEGGMWQAMIKNHGATPQKRTRWIEAGGQRSAEEEITLAPGEAVSLKGSFPPGADRCVLALSGDRFALDDRLPIIQPRPKPIAITSRADPAFDELFQRIITTEAATNITPADLQLATCAASDSALPNGRAIVFLHETAPSEHYLTGGIVAEKDPLMEELSWQALVARETRPFAPQPQDRALLWQGARALIFLRDGQLVFNVDVGQSNAARLPAFVVLVHRFVETIRSAKIASETRNTETNQLLNVSVNAAGGSVALGGDATAPAQAPVLRAPAEPGFAAVAQDGVTLLEAAVHFADVREADLRAAATLDALTSREVALRDRQTREDFLAPLWALLLGGMMIANWAWPARAVQKAERP